MSGVRSMIFKAIQVLVSLAAIFASVRFLFLHAYGTRIGSGGFGVKNRERPIGIVVKLLVGVAMLKEVLATYIYIS